MFVVTTLLLRISRRDCPACHKVRALVADPEIQDYPCPICGAPTIETCGDDRREKTTP